jgi:hypothetical protein
VNLSYSDDDFMIGQMGHSKYSDKYWKVVDIDSNFMIKLSKVLSSEICSDSCPYSENCTEAKESSMCLRERILNKMK